MTSLFNKDGFANKIEKLKENYSKHDDIMKDLMEKWMLLEGTVIDVSRRVLIQKGLLSQLY